jgi:hypothetical protein
MKTIGKAILAAAVVLAVLAGGCGDEKCASESPQVQTLSADCEALPGQRVEFPLQLCPTCNQNLTGCTADMHGADATGGTIFLNPVVEACGTSSSCGPSCATSPSACGFTPPGSAVGTFWTVTVYDPGSGKTKDGKLTIVSSGASCAL